MPKNLRRKLWGDLRANRGQFFAVWLIVMFGTTFYGAMYPAAVNLVDSLYRTYDDCRYLDFQVQLDATLPADAAVVDEVRALNAVTGVEARRVVEGGIQFDSQQHLISLRLISVPDDRALTVNKYEVTTGRDIAAAEELLLLESFATAHDIAPGDTVRVSAAGELHDFTIAGLVFNPEYLVNSHSSEAAFPTPATFGVAWLRYSELTRLSGDGINDIVIRLAGSSQDDKSALDDATRAALSALFPTATILHREQTPSGWMIVANINGTLPMMTFFSGLFLIGATLITGILMARVVQTERSRIGTMRAMGLTRRELVLHYLAFGFIIGVSGGLVGSVLGYLSSFWFMYSFLDNIAGSPVPGFLNTPQVPFILLGFVIVVAGATLSGVYSAWTMSGTSPGIALRPAAPQTPNAISRIKLAFLPLPVRQAIRNVLRTPGRALGTALGVFTGALMVFAALVMWDTLALNFSEYFDSTVFDLRVDLSELQPDATAEAQVAAIEEVQAVQAALIGPVAVVQPDGELFGTVAVALDEHDPFLTLATVEGADAFSTTSGVWIGHNLARVLDIAVGDVLTLRAFEQEHSVTVQGIVFQAIGSPVYIPRGLFIQWTPGGLFPVSSVLVRVEPGQANAVRAALVDLPGISAVEVLDEFDRDMTHYLQYYVTNTMMFGLFGVLLTLAIVFNTVNANLRERRDELAILRALGTRNYEIALIVTLEFLAMALLGVVFGAWFGRLCGAYLITSWDMDYYGVLPSLVPLSYVIGVVGLLITVLVAELPGLRAVQRADLGQVGKAQSF